MSVAHALLVAGLGHCSPRLNAEALRVLAAEVLRLRAAAAAQEPEPEVYDWP